MATLLTRGSAVPKDFAASSFHVCNASLRIKQLATLERVLMGPGPSAVPTRVLQALASPTVGHLDPEYLQIMDENWQLLQTVFSTKMK